jgi:hypothetical protein
MTEDIIQIGETRFEGSASNRTINDSPIASDSEDSDELQNYIRTDTSHNAQISDKINKKIIYEATEHVNIYHMYSELKEHPQNYLIRVTSSTLELFFNGAPPFRLHTLFLPHKVTKSFFIGENNSSQMIPIILIYHYNQSFDYSILQVKDNKMILSLIKSQLCIDLLHCDQMIQFNLSGSKALLTMFKLYLFHVEFDLEKKSVQKTYIRNLVDSSELLFSTKEDHID